jgi:glycine dehydrogenase subunit 2
MKKEDLQPQVRLMIDRSLDKTGGAWCSDDFKTDTPIQNWSKLPLRQELLQIPSLPEVEVVRHFTALSRLSHGVDNGSYPLGSCTMKYNPKSHDAYTHLDGFRNVHPKQSSESLQGLAEMFFHLQNHIAELTGVNAVSLQPAAGAHGELAGMFIIRKYFETKNKKRSVILIADSAHGTNPSSAAMAGFKCKIIPTTTDGLMDLC